MASNLLAHVVNIAWQLGTVPVFLAFWSNERYGEWLLLYSIPGYLALADAGLSTLTANEISMQVSGQQMDKARRSLHTAWGFLVGVTGMLTLVLCVLSWRVPWADWIGLQLINDQVAAWVILLLGLYTLGGLYFPFLGAIYRSTYQAPRHTYLYSLTRLGELLGICVCVWLSQSLVMLAAVLATLRLLSVALMYVDCLHISPNLRPGVSEFSGSELRRTILPSSMFMAFPLGNALYFQGMTILVGRMMGPTAVVVFNTSRVLTRSIPQFVTVIKHSVWTEFSYLFGARDYQRARRLLGLSTEATGFAVVCIGVVLYYIGDWIIQVWTHDAVKVDDAVLLVFIAGAALNSLWNLLSSALMSANQHSSISLWFLLSTGLALVSAMMLIGIQGIIGAGWSMVLCEAMMLPYVLHSTCKLLRVPLWDMLGSLISFRHTREFLAKRFA